MVFSLREHQARR